jgi:hypothetical protein
VVTTTTAKRKAAHKERRQRAVREGGHHHWLLTPERQIAKARKVMQQELPALMPDQRAQLRTDIENKVATIRAEAPGLATLAAARSHLTVRTWQTYHRALLKLSKSDALRRVDAAAEALRRLGWRVPVDAGGIKSAVKDTEMQLNWNPQASAVEEYAVKLAHDLLAKWGVKTVTTRKKPWWKLSAILFGDENADLYRHLLKYVRSRPAT